MLGYQWGSKTAGLPVVFLHGLLGSTADWSAVLAQLQKIPQIRPLVIDLPFHATSQTCHCSSFAEVRQQLHNTLVATVSNQPFWLVGYSLGGRIAMDYWFNAAPPNLKGIILEGANVGLTTEQARQARWQADLAWAARFQHEPIWQVLQDWYQQPVFADLTDAQRTALIAQRQQNQGSLIAQMLQVTSLAKQADFSQSNWQNVTFLIGEKDQKFRQLAMQYQLPHRLIAQAGHNTHRANPTAFVAELRRIIK